MKGKEITSKNLAKSSGIERFIIETRQSEVASITRQCSSDRVFIISETNNLIAKKLQNSQILKKD